MIPTTMKPKIAVLAQANLEIEGKIKLGCLLKILNVVPKNCIKQ